MIPKIIHYCWFGGNPLPKAAKKCIETWKKYCPDYTIMAWDESNYDISSAPLYVRQAYEAKKWAFVADVARLQALYQYGGIYLDTDVEVIRPLDVFLHHRAFGSFEDGTGAYVQMGIIAVEKHFPLIGEFLSQYDDRPFLINGQADLTTNVKVFSAFLKSKGLVPNNQYQEIDSFAVYSFDYFCPMDVHTMEVRTTPNTYTIHLYAGTWLSDKDAKLRAYKLRKLWLEQKLGPRWGSIYESLHFSRKKYGGKGLSRFLKRAICGKMRKLFCRNQQDKA